MEVSLDDSTAAERQEVALLLRRLTVELDAVGQRFAELHGLNRTDVRALVAIMDAARRGQALTAGGLGDAVELRSASVTALLDRLEKAGHVRRIRDAEDRRRVVLEMSDSAMAAGASFFGGLQRELLAAMEGYTDEELAVVHRFRLRRGRRLAAGRAGGPRLTPLRPGPGHAAR